MEFKVRPAETQRIAVEQATPVINRLPRPAAPVLVVDDFEYQFDGLYISNMLPPSPHNGDLWIRIGA